MERRQHPTGALEKEQQPIHQRALAFLRALVSDWRPLGTDWQPTQTQRLWIVRTAVVLGILIATGYPFGITLWEWLQLLIVPAVLAAGGAWFNRQQQQREEESANKRAAAELTIQEQDAREAALQAYLDKMTQLLLEKDLRGSEKDSPERTLARARTLTVLRGLDPRRKRSVLDFLYEANLIKPGPSTDSHYTPLPPSLPLGARILITGRPI